MLTSTLPRFPGDQQANFVGEQAQAWSGARPEDRITILAPGDVLAPASERQHGVRIERFAYMWPASMQRLAYPAIMPNIRRKIALCLLIPPFLLAEYLAARRLAKDIAADIVYAHWVVPQGLVALRLKRSLGIPFVLQNHSSDLDVLLKLGRPGRAIARTLLREAAHFFCVNEAQAQVALGLFAGDERGVIESKITTLPMGVAELPPVLGASEVRYDIATIGRLTRKKGLNYLIEAAELLAASDIRPRIGIAGDGEEIASLKALVARADITFTGFLSGPEKEQFLASSARFVFPAKAADGDVEGMPVALLEGLMRGLPVLASRDTNIAMLPEWSALQEKVVFIEDPADVPALAESLVRVLALGRDDMRKVSLTVARYRWNKLIWEYLQAVDRILGRAVQFAVPVAGRSIPTA